MSSMIVRSGIDIISLKEAQAVLKDPKKLARMLSPDDIAEQRSEHIAGRISLKESVMKATGLAGKKDAWERIHIRRAKSGRPIITIDNPPRSLVSIDGSVAHHGDYVVTSVVALYEDTEEIE